MKTLADNGMKGSMGRVGACADNAAMESFFALLQKSVLYRHRWSTKQLRNNRPTGPTFGRNEVTCPTAQDPQDAVRIRNELHSPAEIRQRTSQYIAQHGKRIRREIEANCRARKLRGPAPLDVDAELIRKIRTSTGAYAQLF